MSAYYSSDLEPGVCSAGLINIMPQLPIQNKIVLPSCGDGVKNTNREQWNEAHLT